MTDWRLAARDRGDFCPRLAIGLSLVLYGTIALIASPNSAAAETLFAAPFLRLDTGASPASVAIGDLDSDGRLDLAVTNRDERTVSVLLGTHDGTFSPRTDYTAGGGPCSVAIGDFNADARPDLVVANFEDHTVSVLLGNGNGAFGPKRDFATGYGPSSVVTADFNLDGKSDLAVVNGALSPGTVSVLLGNGDGTFGTRRNYATGDHSNCVAVGDLNADGKPDLAVASRGADADAPGAVWVLLGSGNGTFEVLGDYETGNVPAWVTIGDLTMDGAPELVVVNSGSNTVSVLLGTGDGTFGVEGDYEVGSAPSCVAIGELDSNGMPDLVVANASSNSVSVLPGNGDGTFGLRRDHATEAGPEFLALRDLDADGRLDLVVANSGDSSVWVQFGSGDGAFGTNSGFGTGNAPSSVAIGDLNADHRPDLVVTNFDDHTVSVLLGDGNGAFGAKNDYGVRGNPKSVAFGDLDGDGTPDLVVATHDGAWFGSVSILLGEGDGTFGVKDDWGINGGHANSIAIEDLDADGKADVAVANETPALPYEPHGQVSVLCGRGDGKFGLSSNQYTAGSQSRSVAIADLNADGKPDLVAANESAYPNWSGSVTILLGTGNAQFWVKYQYETGDHASGVAIGDLDADGRPDLVVTSESENIASVFLGIGDGTFGARRDFKTGTGPISAAIGDLDGDNAPDLVVANRDQNTLSVLLGNGDGTLGAKCDYGVGEHPSSVAICDLNADGQPDLVASNEGSNTVSILINIRPTTADVVSDSPLARAVLRLGSPKPNPSRGSSEIRYVLPAACLVDATLFDLGGRIVRSLVVRERLAPGEHSVRWDGRDASGTAVHPGVYLLKVCAGHDVGVRKFIVLR